MPIFAILTSPEGKAPHVWGTINPWLSVLAFCLCRSKAVSRDLILASYNENVDLTKKNVNLPSGYD